MTDFDNMPIKEQGKRIDRSSSLSFGEVVLLLFHGVMITPLLFIVYISFAMFVGGIKIGDKNYNINIFPIVELKIEQNKVGVQE